VSALSPAIFYTAVSAKHAADPPHPNTHTSRWVRAPSVLQAGSLKKGNCGSCPPEEDGGGHGPALSIVLNAVAEAGGVPMADIVPAHYVHGRRVDRRDPGHLHDHPAGPSRAVDDALSGRHPALGEWLHAGHQGPEPTETGVVRIPSMPRHIMARRVRRIRERLLQLVAEDGVADRPLRAVIWQSERVEQSTAEGLKPRLRRLVSPGLALWIARLWHLEASSWGRDPWIRPVSRRSRNGNRVILCTIIITYVKRR
jgi:hypothetical protein